MGHLLITSTLHRPHLVTLLGRYLRQLPHTLPSPHEERCVEPCEFRDERLSLSSLQLQRLPLNPHSSQHLWREHTIRHAQRSHSTPLFFSCLVTQIRADIDKRGKTVPTKISGDSQEVKKQNTHSKGKISLVISFGLLSRDL